MPGRNIFPISDWRRAHRPGHSWYTALLNARPVGLALRSAASLQGFLAGPRTPLVEAFKFPLIKYNGSDPLVCRNAVKIFFDFLVDTGGKILTG